MAGDICFGIQLFLHSGGPLFTESWFVPKNHALWAQAKASTSGSNF